MKDCSRCRQRHSLFLHISYSTCGCYRSIIHVNQRNDMIRALMLAHILFVHLQEAFTTCRNDIKHDSDDLAPLVAGTDTEHASSH